MLTTNPFAELTAAIPPGVMQVFIAVMIALVILGTIYDVIHKGSAKYFSRVQAKSAEQASRQIGGGEKMGVAVKTLVVDVAASGEFCNPHRRIAHLLSMYGFVLYLLTTILLVYVWPTQEAAAPALVVLLWYVGALMVCAGGYWFWFFIRVDVRSEGNSPFRLMRADLFIVSLLLSVTFGIIWAIAQTSGGGTLAWIFLALYLVATTVLFAGIPWSKFAHMFFKPAAAFEKRVAYANGSAMNLPTLTRDDPAQRERHSMQLLRDAPMDMGLGIKREAPHHY